MKIEDIEGIGPAYAAKLMEVGVSTTEALLNAGASATGRSALAAKSGLSGTLILEWVNHADLMRVPGVGSEYSDLLEAAGVDTVPELAQRSAANLAAQLAEVNEAKHLVRAVPTEANVTKWIAAAKDLPRVVMH